MPGRRTAAIAIWAICLAQALSAGDTPPAAAWVPQDGDVVVLLGDEITQQAGYSQYLEDFFLTRFPGASIRLVNAGVHGSLTEWALDRFTADIAIHRPTHVIVQLGMHDAGLQPYRDELFQKFRRDITQLDRQIRDLGAIPIYLSPTIFDARAARQQNLVDHDPDALPLINATLAYYGVWLREFAAEAPANFIDLHGPLTRLTRQARLANPEFTLVPDGLHPAPSGQFAIATAILEEWGLDRPLSSIHISSDRAMLAATADGGSVLNLQSTALDTVSFLWQAEALPWSIPPEAATTRELLELLEQFNRETLQVQGLTAGTYEVLIDGRLMGRFTPEQLATGIDLQALSTPQSEQSRLIAQGNRERTDAAIRPARSDWVLRQEHARVRDAAVKDPDNQNLKQKLAEIEQALDGFEDRQARFALAAEDQLTRLQEQAQPIPRQFVIRPVLTAQVHGRILLGGMPVSGALVEFHGLRGLVAVGSTDAMGAFQLKSSVPEGIPPGDGWLVVLAKMVLPKFISIEKSGHRITLRPGINEIELHFEEAELGQ